jgi:hypothetical protein
VWRRRCRRHSGYRAVARVSVDARAGIGALEPGEVRIPIRRAGKANDRAGKSDPYRPEHGPEEKRCHHLCLVILLQSLRQAGAAYVFE